MSFDLTGIYNQNEYYTNHYFSSIFEENAESTISAWRNSAKENENIKTPWAMIRETGKQYYVFHERYLRNRFDTTTLSNIKSLADSFMKSLGYPEAEPLEIYVADELNVPVYLEIKKSNGAPLLWILLAASPDKDERILQKKVFNSTLAEDEELNIVKEENLTPIDNETLASKILFGMDEAPRFIIFMGMNQIALIDRNKWNEKRYLEFELEEIFSRHEETTLQAMSVLLHKDSLCPVEGTALIDELDANSQKHAAGVSQDLKYALRESIELLGNEVLYDLKTRLGRNLEANPVDAGELTLHCLRYMYRMLFVLFIESRPELGYAPIKSQSYYSGYSLESLRDIAENIRDEVTEVGSGYYLHETLSKLYDLIYTGYPATEKEIIKYSHEEGLHDMFVIQPLKAHIFDPEYTKLITDSKLRNSVMLKIIDLMSLTRSSDRRNERRGRISYANLGINQLGAVYEALLSYRGFIAQEDLYEVKRKGDSFNELDVGYFVKESELEQYEEDERVRYEHGENTGKLRMYKKGTFIYRLAGREREKSASYYTPEVLTKCLVKYALKELLKDKTADEILNLTVCEPAMGSAAFLNEAINQLAEAYIDKKQKELGESIRFEDRFTEVQKVKMYIADRNVFGIDLNPIAVELAEVSLWLNTIYTGGFVPWFGTQLVNGNSLIGARRQCYSENQLKQTSQGLRWYENAPERVPLGTDRKTRKGSSQIYHFLVGDPEMCSYNDKVIKSLEPDNIKKMKAWNKEFIKPYENEDIITLGRLSSAIDKLWEGQIQLRKKVEVNTRDNLSVYGHRDNEEDSHTTIRQKDKIFTEIYKTEHQQNAGPYARLKFAMDYWCALWFWPIEKAELLPSRSEFFFDMSLILEGTIDSVEKIEHLTLFPELNEMSQQAKAITDMYGIDNVVDIDKLCKTSPRLALVRQIAQQNHFMHWELEFADLFKERGGFDLVIGNPPWILLGWNEQGVLADRHPIFVVKKLTATQTIQHREEALKDKEINTLYFQEYEAITGEQSFLNAKQNYPDLVGMKANLYKCFLPQAWNYGSETGVSAFVHPEGVYDDPAGGELRRILLQLVRKHFMFANELKLFAEVHHHTTFSLNVYGGQLTAPYGATVTPDSTVSFDSISNLYAPTTIDQCYENKSSYQIPGIKENGVWNTLGHPFRIIHIGKKELKLFSELFDENDDWQTAKLPELHAKQYVEVLERFADSEIVVGNYSGEISSSSIWNETNAQNDHTIKELSRFPNKAIELIYTGSNIHIGNPVFKAARSKCVINSDFDNIDLTNISDEYLQRCKYSIDCPIDEYLKRVPLTTWETKFTDEFRIVTRGMLNQSGERTWICAIAASGFAHIHGVISLALNNSVDMVTLAGCESSLPYDFFVKCIGKANLFISTINRFPMVNSNKWWQITLRALLLNCLTKYYSPLWQNCWNEKYVKDLFTKSDPRLKNTRFSSLTENWTWDTPLRTDYERRQALVEIDVLTAMALGMTLEQLKTIYRIQFPVLQQYESDTWYDANGRIVFTTNRSLTGVGYDRPTWENSVKGAAPGTKFTRTITDDTMPGGPVQRTIEYVAPFDKCNREQDYETAWAFFEKKYGKVGD